jgi:hypothetical protein
VNVEFVKVDERLCLARARRSDGALLETTATAKGGFPHDLEHFVVEAALGYQDGFWGRVARGAEFRGMRVVTAKPRRRSRQENQLLARGYDGWGEDLVWRVVATYRQCKTMGWVPPAPLPETRTRNRLLDPRNNPFVQVPTMSGATIERACVDLDRTAQEWAGLAVGGSLTRSWPG